VSLQNFIAAARAEGLNVCLSSGYRDYYTQQYLFNNKVAQLGGNEAAAARIVLPPGTSEHQLGLAADILCTSRPWLDEGQAKTETQKWLMANCHKYGFILRYPKGTTPITGIIYEPWHYRYVGVEIATEIMTRGITLEEYLGKIGAP
jgi:LAS superfamily LD-carboxypeptidase LdcB